MIQGMEAAVRGLFFPPGETFGVVVYAKDELRKLIEGQYTSSGKEADDAVAQAIEARYTAITEGQNSASSPAFA